VDQGDRGHQHVSRDVLEQAGRKLVRRNLATDLVSRFRSSHVLAAVLCELRNQKGHWHFNHSSVFFWI
jgi:hypothetical protein